MVQDELAAGISRDLARQRAEEIRDLRYRLDLRIAPAASLLQGSQQIRFVLKRAPKHQALVLDWRPQLASAEIERTLRTLLVNGCRCAQSVLRPGHLLIPARALVRGENCLELQWKAPIQTSAGALTRYRDAEDGAAYVYSLFVPADASSVFPCFDQPDLKARFNLTLTVPAGWSAIANGRLAESRPLGRYRRFAFLATEPISTYAFAFAAGPFVAIRSKDKTDATRLWVRRSQRRRAQRHAQDVLRLNHEALRFCARYFQYPFPFAKYDLVLIAQFPYRGMEHAGATFLNEDSVLLPKSHGAQERFQRAQLIFHETAHQWMGDLVTMRWFDDLWIKEGFANFMAYKLAERVCSREHARLAFHDLKLSAYETDSTAGATALHHPLADLTQAKSAYNNIVYAKAPAVLRALEHKLGKNVFRSGARALVRDHALGGVDWRDFIAAMEHASGRCLRRWARNWILRAGVPNIHAREGDPAEHVYALITLERDAVTAAMRSLARSRNVLRRAQLWEGLWNAVQDITLDPIRFVEAALASLHRDRSETVLARMTTRLSIVMDRFISADEQQRIVPELEELAWSAFRASTDRSMRLTWLRSLIAFARTDQGYARLRAILATRNLDLSACDRLALGAALIAGARAEVKQIVTELATDAASQPRGLIVHCLQAARPDGRSKRRVFNRWLDDRALPEHWIDTALPFLNHPAHAHLTLALLPAALDALPALLRTRKIFLVNRWLSAFIGGQVDRAALAIVRAFLSRKTLVPELRLKVLEAVHPLERAVAIRAHWSSSPRD
jgi:aminopeptidase N